MSLREYSRKRDFSKTSEPAPKSASIRGKAAHKSAARSRKAEQPGAKVEKGKSRFVIQKHDASRLHYDFRLELDGVLKSWAVPKGIPSKHGDKRLAVHVEDHPLDYADFEGIIPAGEYGGGTVMVWDTGTWEPVEGDARSGLAAGKLKVRMHGSKLEGEWTLVRTRNEESWLLIKTEADMAPISKRRDDQSAISGRTMKAIATERTREWSSNRSESDPDKKPSERPLGLRERIRQRAEAVAPKPDKSKQSRGGKRPVFVEPMKAKLVKTPPSGGDWIYELKFDGFRALAIKAGSECELWSRNGKDLGRKFSELLTALKQIPAQSAMLDGEIVALDAQGRSSFQLLQQYELNQEPPLCFYVFDLLELEGEDLRGQALSVRKERLKSLLKNVGDPIRFSADIEGDPNELLKQVKSRGLEGLIGKRSSSRYESGLRTGSWIKLKCVNEQEFVIGGFTPPQGSRSSFGALLVGYYQGKSLKFAGKVGTGFSDALLKMLHRQFLNLKRDTCPFGNLPEKQGGRWSQNITPAEMKRCTWVEPLLVCQVKFTELTDDQKLRHPVFLGIREDVEASEVGLSG